MSARSTRPARAQACIKCGAATLSALNLPLCVSCDGSLAREISGFRLEVSCRRDRPGAFNNIDDAAAPYPASKVALVDCDNPRHRELEALFCAAPDLLAACRITSSCSPVQAVLDALPDDVEITLTFCAADLKQIRAAIAKTRVA